MGLLPDRSGEQTGVDSFMTLSTELPPVAAESADPDFLGSFGETTDAMSSDLQSSQAAVAGGKPLGADTNDMSVEESFFKISVGAQATGLFGWVSDDLKQPDKASFNASYPPLPGFGVTASISTKGTSRSASPTAARRISPRSRPAPT